jgi:hypothetical protein
LLGGRNSDGLMRDEDDDDDDDDDEEDELAPIKSEYLREYWATTAASTSSETDGMEEFFLRLLFAVSTTGTWNELPKEHGQNDKMRASEHLKQSNV